MQFIFNIIIDTFSGNSSDDQWIFNARSRDPRTKTDRTRSKYFPISDRTGTGPTKFRKSRTVPDQEQQNLENLGPSWTDRLEGRMRKVQWIFKLRDWYWPVLRSFYAMKNMQMFQQIVINLEDMKLGWHHYREKFQRNFLKGAHAGAHLFVKYRNNSNHLLLRKFNFDSLLIKGLLLS